LETRVRAPEKEPRATRRELKLYPISGVKGEGIEKLKFAMAEAVEKVRKKLAKSQEETQVTRFGD
jgi:hypothetical protein